MSEPEGLPPRVRGLKVVAAVLLVVFLAADLISKQMVMDAGLLPKNPLTRNPGDGGVRDVIPGFFALQGSWNTGVTFGMAPGRTPEILVLTSAATLALMTWLLATRNPSRLLHVGLGLIISGALGNLYDRIHWLAVRDFLLIYLGDLSDPSWTWPNFNVADSCIVVGVSLVILEALFGKAHAAAPRAAASPAA